MLYNNKILVGKNEAASSYIVPKMANRHGLIAGATGTGKTVTLKVLAESFSELGVPVFLADVKGDLAATCQSGTENEEMNARLAKLGLRDVSFSYHGYPVTFWDIWGKKGLPLRTTISEMGPVLLARLMDLTATQSDILQIVFKIADDENLLLIDTKDLRSMLTHVAEHAKEYGTQYGNIAKASVNVIQRNLVALEEQGADQFFGEPALDIRDWFRTDTDGRGMINILDSSSLIGNPMMYSTFMLWMMSELFEVLPETGDAKKPKMIFFFDEAHLLFHDAPKALLQKTEQVVKLIRSKGVGIYFITQSPRDIPDGILAQLGNKVQHALHAYTPAEQKAIKAAADSFRANPSFDTKTALQELGVGEALVSFLDENGVPEVVERVMILPPQSKLGPIEEDVRQQEINQNLLSVRYSTMIDRDSAYEFFQRKAAQDAQRVEEEKAQTAKKNTKEKSSGKSTLNTGSRTTNSRKKDSLAEKTMKSAVRSAGGTVGRQIGNEIGKSIGGSFGKRLGGNVGASIGRGLLGTIFGK